ncbi:MAG: hypothetical protein JWQ89_333 [Devosia sp.]|uniref:hypothetical protein n=1 Tax=Devosia sp. TaxID=1871048 RepID=UPI00262D75F1|nr:hypothetical protein [Devosia sp.]MDB5538606.1 hypothetical protein [Devosia sp.]
MVAGLLYIVGLIAVVVTVVMVGLNAPGVIQTFNQALGSASSDLLGAVGDVARSLQWALWPFVGGLVLMGLGRIVMLLASINRSLRGNA